MMFGRAIRSRLRVRSRSSGPNAGDDHLRQYWADGAHPWRAGYKEAKRQLIAETLADTSLMERFRGHLPLPPRYGFGVDERCVEYPWALAHLGSTSEPLLDAGSVMNHAYLLEEPPFDVRQLHILTLAPEPRCFWQRGISYLYADLRSIPVRDEFYGNVLCLSTLEHVGCNNSAHSGLPAHHEHRPNDFVTAVRELRRVLRPGGTLFITVPFGRYQHHDTFQQFDAAMVVRMVDASAVDAEFFRYDADGWQPARESECVGLAFSDGILSVWRGDRRVDELVTPPDHAAAARAVACLRMVKP
jgi:SAM-dependent methyltransferase